MNDEQRDYAGFTELESTVMLTALQRLLAGDGLTQEGYELLERLSKKIAYFTYSDNLQ